MQTRIESDGKLQLLLINVQALKTKEIRRTTAEREVLAAVG